MSLSIKYSTKGLQTVVPTGISTYDDLIGGGLALTSLNIIDGDVDQSYSAMFGKAYISSGIQSNQRIIIFSSVIRNKQSRFLCELPVSQHVNLNESNQRNDPMNIAFRYSQLPSRFSNENEGEEISKLKLDYGQHLSRQVIEDASIDFYDHMKMLEVLEDEVEKYKKNGSAEVTRIYIDHLGSSLSFLPDEDIPIVLFRIKVLLRRLPKSVCLVNLLSDSNKPINSCLRHRIYNQADSVTSLIGFLDNDHNDGQFNAYCNDYVGILQLYRLSRLNSFAPYNSSLEGTEYGLKLRNSKRYLVVEKLAVPPDLSETVNRFSCSHNEIKKDDY